MGSQPVIKRKVSADIERERILGGPKEMAGRRR